MAKQRTLRPNLPQTPRIPLPAFSNDRTHATSPSHEQGALAQNEQLDEQHQGDVPVQKEDVVVVELRPAHDPAPTAAPAPTAGAAVSAVGPDGQARVLRYIDVTLIDPHPLAPREVYTERMILQRAEDLREQGQHDPIHVIPNPSAHGRFIICDGWTRTQACQQHNVLPALLAEIHSELSLQDSAWFGYQQNEGREQQCDLDRAMFFEKMLAQGLSAAEICRRTGIAKASMTFFRAFNRLPDDVLDIIRVHPKKFGSTEAYHLSKLYERVGLVETVELATTYAEKNQTVSWLRNQVKALLTPTAPVVPAQNKLVTYKNGVFKQAGYSFELSLTVEADRRDAFASALEKLLADFAVNEESAPADGNAE